MLPGMTCQRCALRTSYVTKAAGHGQRRALGIAAEILESTQKKPAAAQNQKLSEPLRRCVDWSRVTAAQLLECRKDYQDAKAYNAGHGHGATSWPRSAPKTSSPKPCGSTLLGAAGRKTVELFLLKGKPKASPSAQSVRGSKLKNALATDTNNRGLFTCCVTRCVSLSGCHSVVLEP